MSNAKRRDNKGRVLQMGENQLDDGRYVYRYTNPYGQRKTVYSWRLTASDPMPAGRRKDKSLREKIKDIEKQLRLEICCEDITVCELVEKYLMTKTGVKHSTQTGTNLCKISWQRSLLDKGRLQVSKHQTQKFF